MARPFFSMFTPPGVELHLVDESPDGTFDTPRYIPNLPEMFPGQESMTDAGGRTELSGGNGMIRVVLENPGRGPITLNPAALGWPVLDVLSIRHDAGAGAVISPGSAIDGLVLRRANTDVLSAELSNAGAFSIWQTPDERVTFRAGQSFEELIGLLPSCQEPQRNRGGTVVECAGVRAIQGGPVPDENIRLEVFAIAAE